MILAYLWYMPGRSSAIANEFIRRAAREARHLTHMQLQKLVYIAHGWNLAINGHPLTTDEPQAWDYGPVYPDIFDALRGYGNRPVTREISDGDFGPSMFGDQPLRAGLNADENAVIDRVFRDYGNFHAYRLSALTHQEGAPWDQVYNHGDGKYGQINADRIRKHFIELARRSTAA